MFSGVYWNQPVYPYVCPSIHLFVCPSVHVSVCVQNTTFCQSAAGDINSHLVCHMLGVLIWTSAQFRRLVKSRLYQTTELWVRPNLKHLEII